MIGIRCKGDTTGADKLAAISRGRVCGADRGLFDAIIEVVCEDDDDLLDLLKPPQIRALPGVISPEKLVYRRNVSSNTIGYKMTTK